MTTIALLVTCPCDACGSRPCGAEDILCVPCRAKVHAMKAGRACTFKGGVCIVCGVSEFACDACGGVGYHVAAVTS